MFPPQQQVYVLLLFSNSTDNVEVGIWMSPSLFIDVRETFMSPGSRKIVGCLRALCGPIGRTIRVAVCLHIQQQNHKRILYSFPQPISVRF